MPLLELFSRGEEEKALKNIVSRQYLFKTFSITTLRKKLFPNCTPLNAMYLINLLYE